MRARNIKPGFFDNEYLAECDPLARILFIGLWCMADREGRLEDRPKRIRKQILGYDNCDVNALLDQLASAPNGKGDQPFIVRYEVDGRRFIQIINFLKHQYPHAKEPESSIPEPPNNDSMCHGDFCNEHHTCTVQVPDEHHTCTVQVPDEHHTCTVQVPDEHGSGPAESLILNPESLILNPESNKNIVGQKNDCPTSRTENVIPYEKIVAHLNLRTGKQFKDESKQTRALIKARWNEGFREDDFFRVIDIKADKWGTDPKFLDYLRPQTLFSGKFEAYLNEPQSQPTNTLDGCRIR